MVDIIDTDMSFCFGDPQDHTLILWFSREFRI